MHVRRGEVFRDRGETERGHLPLRHVPPLVVGAVHVARLRRRVLRERGHRGHRAFVRLGRARLLHRVRVEPVLPDVRPDRLPDGPPACSTIRPDCASRCRSSPTRNRTSTTWPTTRRRSPARRRRRSSRAAAKASPLDFAASRVHLGSRNFSRTRDSPLRCGRYCLEIDFLYITKIICSLMRVDDDDTVRACRAPMRVRLPGA